MFNESINPKVYERIDNELNSCDLFIIVRKSTKDRNKSFPLFNGDYFFTKIGTSSVVYPAAGFASLVSERNVPIAEFNLDEVQTSKETQYTYSKYLIVVLAKIPAFNSPKIVGFSRSIPFFNFLSDSEFEWF